MIAQLDEWLVRLQDSIVQSNTGISPIAHDSNLVYIKVYINPSIATQRGRFLAAVEPPAFRKVLIRVAAHTPARYSDISTIGRPLLLCAGRVLALPWVTPC